jgi:2-polyprenyl-3-methyl-5-hydroxy-6-metoxy-1,4-benzoquinol methylase
MFSKRSTEQEIMDDLHCKGDVVNQTLKELDIINSWLGGNNVTLNAFKKCLDKVDTKKFQPPLRIADLGCGSGDLLKLIAQQTKKKNIPVKLKGIDANQYIINYARKNTSQFPEIIFQTQDVLSDEFKKEKFDIVNCTLFCHHFDDTILSILLKNLRQQTSTAIIINDIHRHWFAYHSIKILTSVFSKSEMVKFDAKLSVLRAFKKEELEKIIKEAGFTKYSIKWKWAFRYEAILYI